MKKSVLILFITLFLLSFLLFTACDAMHDFFMRNKSSYTIYVLAPDFRTYGDKVHETSEDYKKRSHSIYIDTIPPLLSINYTTIISDDTKSIYDCWTTYLKRDFHNVEKLYSNSNTGYLSWFVYKETKKIVDGEEVAQRVCIQRYDLAYDDAVRHMNVSNIYGPHTFQFPPAEHMKDLKMWPPYGTYDKHGNVRETITIDTSRFSSEDAIPDHTRHL